MASCRRSTDRQRSSRNTQAIASDEPAATAREANERRTAACLPWHALRNIRDCDCCWHAPADRSAANVGTKEYSSSGRLKWKRMRHRGHERVFCSRERLASRRCDCFAASLRHQPTGHASGAVRLRNCLAATSGGVRRIRHFNKRPHFDCGALCANESVRSPHSRSDIRLDSTRRELAKKTTPRSTRKPLANAQPIVAFARVC